MEGLLDTIKEHMQSLKLTDDEESVQNGGARQPAENGSAAEQNGGAPETRSADEVLEGIIARLETKFGLTLILDDPTGNSFITGPDSTERYTRSREQDEELGFNDMLTEGYSATGPEHGDQMGV